VIADTGGLVVTDDGRRINIFDRRTGGLAVAAVILGTLTLVAGGLGVAALISGTPSSGIGAALLGAAVVLAALLFMVSRRFRHRRNAPLHACRSVAVLDRKLNLFSYGGGALVQLDQVRFARKFQIGSSSPKLIAVTPGGTKALKRGNPFDGGVGEVDEILNGVVRAL
jgi:hypothetical protein